MPLSMPYMQTNLDMDTLMQLAASTESLQAEQVVLTSPVLTAVIVSAGAIVWTRRLLGAAGALWADCDPQ